MFQTLFMHALHTSVRWCCQPPVPDKMTVTVFMVSGTPPHRLGFGLDSARPHSQECTHLHGLGCVHVGLASLPSARDSVHFARLNSPSSLAGETNTDDLSPAPDAWSRPDIPVHAQVGLLIPYGLRAATRLWQLAQESVLDPFPL